MSLTRLLLLVVLALIPLALFRELWWSDLLFARPWAKNGGGDLDLGTFASLLAWPFSGLLSVVLGFAAALVIDMIAGTLRRATLPILVIIGLSGGMVLTFLHPNMGWIGFWPLGGFLVTALVWIFAVLQVGRSD